MLNETIDLCPHNDDTYERALNHVASPHGHYDFDVEAI